MDLYPGRNSHYADWHLGVFFIPDFPKEARWLTDEERKFVMARVGTNEEQITSGNIIAFFMDIKNVLGGIIYFGKFGRHSLLPRKCRKR